MSANDIIGFCQAAISHHMNDCAGFVRDVANRCGVLMPGKPNANEIIETYLLRPASGWTILGSEADAVKAAMSGQLVIGGLKASGHGHVVVVVGMENSAHPGRAHGFWGRYHGMKAGALGPEINVGALHFGHGSLTLAWNATALSKVRYSEIKPSELLLQNAPKGVPYHL
jgi:hypothetical protein